MSLDGRLLLLCKEFDITEIEVFGKYGEIYHYVLANYPISTQKQYEEISYIRTKNFFRAMKNERRLVDDHNKNPKGYGHGV